jgi:cyclic pyranopterin phosphate synthase
MTAEKYATRDVSVKSNTLRFAMAEATLAISASTHEAIRTGALPKADPIGVAKVAGIQAAKQTSLLIPHCHQVPLDYIAVHIVLEKESVTITSEVKAIWRTGVEMEALTAVSVAALTLYDMLKAVDDAMEIRSVRLLEKRGGKSSLTVRGKGLSAAVVVASDSVHSGKAKDSSGELAVARLRSLEFDRVEYVVLPDDADALKKLFITLADEEKIDLIVTTGGTGVSPRDVTPEATLAVVTRRLDGVEEALRSFGQDRLPTAMMSRSVVGVRNKTLIINLPGARQAVEDGFNALFPQILHTFRILRGERHTP